MAFKSKYTNRDLTKWESGFQGNDKTNTAYNKKTEAENALKNLGDFTYKNQAAYDKLLNEINNRDKFTYDLNADALYQQYKDNYINQGRQAMMDTMGQAAAMTGGYGNSYAATVGNQTYQGYLQNLNNIVPELYQMAMSRYQMEGDQLNNRFAVLQADKDSELNLYNTKLKRLTGDRDYYANDYHNIYNTALSEWNSNRDYDTSLFWNEHNAGYQAEQDAIANALAQKQYDLEVQQLAEQRKANDQSQTIANLKAQLENAKNAYAVDSYKEVPDNVRNQLDKYLDAIDSEFKSSVSMVQQKKAINNISKYIDTMVNSNVLSPETGDALMSEYAYLVEAKHPKSEYLNR